MQERISEFEARAIEMIQSGKQRDQHIGEVDLSRSVTSASKNEQKVIYT